MVEECRAVTVRAVLMLTNGTEILDMAKIRLRPIPDIFRVPVVEVGEEVILFLPMPCKIWIIAVAVPVSSILLKTHNTAWTATRAWSLTVAAPSTEATPSLPQAVAMRQDIQATDMQE